MFPKVGVRCKQESGAYDFRDDSGRWSCQDGRTARLHTSDCSLLRKHEDPNLTPNVTMKYSVCKIKDNAGALVFRRRTFYIIEHPHLFLVEYIGTRPAMKPHGHLGSDCVGVYQKVHTQVKQLIIREMKRLGSHVSAYNHVTATGINLPTLATTRKIIGRNRKMEGYTSKSTKTTAAEFDLVVAMVDFNNSAVREVAVMPEQAPQVYMWMASSLLELYKCCCLDPRFYYQEVLCLDKTYNLCEFFVTGFWFKNNAFAHNEDGINKTPVMFGCALVHTTNQW
jgi:hypothetical protein